MSTVKVSDSSHPPYNFEPWSHQVAQLFILENRLAWEHARVKSGQLVMNHHEFSWIIMNHVLCKKIWCNQKTLLWLEESCNTCNSVEAVGYVSQMSSDLHQEHQSLTIIDDNWWQELHWSCCKDHIAIVWVPLDFILNEGSHAILSESFAWT